MSLSSLKRVPPPPPAPDREACAACKAFAAECLVPVGDDAVPMCWLCAHHVVDHDTPIEGACEGECDCRPHQIYPDSSLMTPARQADFSAAIARRGRC